MKRLVAILSLFGSVGTLFCCALPLLLVSLGMGAAFASLGSHIPQIYWLTERKDLLFLTTGVLLALSFILIKRAEKLSCPIDPQQREACEVTKPFGKKLFFISVFLYLIGLFFSYLLPVILYGS